MGWPMLEMSPDGSPGDRKARQVMQVAVKNKPRQKSASTRRARPIPLDFDASVNPAVSAQIVELRRLRRRSDRVFEVLLGAAACLSLVAVVNQATEAHSTEQPPPDFFVQTD